MRKHMLWLRAAYWVGILADAVVVVLMLSPRLYVKFYSLALTPDAAFGLGLKRAAPLMAGWTALLFWADREPVERKGVLLLTACPVMVGYVLYRIYATVDGFISVRQLVSSIVVETLIAVLFVVGYLSGRALESDR